MKIYYNDIHETIDRIRQEQDDEYWESRFSGEDEEEEEDKETESEDK